MVAQRAALILHTSAVDVLNHASTVCELCIWSLCCVAVLCFPGKPEHHGPTPILMDILIKMTTVFFFFFLQQIIVF